MARNLNIKFTLGHYLFGAVKLTKNADPDKYGYSAHDVQCGTYPPTKTTLPELDPQFTPPPPIQLYKKDTNVFICLVLKNDHAI